MATLLIVGNSEGARRCDGKCHDAEPGTACDCCCGGRYHALGSQGARDQIEEDAREGRFGAELAEIAQHLTGEARQGQLW